MKKYVSVTRKSKKKGKYQDSIHSSTTPDPGYQWESDNFTIRHHKQEPFSAGDHKASINRPAQKHNKKKQINNINNPQKNMDGRSKPPPLLTGIRPIQSLSLKCTGICVHKEVWSFCYLLLSVKLIF